MVLHVPNNPLLYINYHHVTSMGSLLFKLTTPVDIPGSRDITSNVTQFAGLDDHGYYKPHEKVSGTFFVRYLVTSMVWQFKILSLEVGG